MRKLLPLLVVGIFVLSGLGAVALPRSEETELIKIESFSFSQPIVKTQNEYVSIDIDEANSFIMEQGKPMLPSYVHTFTFPFGTKIKSVTCTPMNIQTLSVPKDLKPTPKAVLVGSAVSIDQEAPINYGTEPYPANWFTYDVACGRYYGELSIIVETEASPIKYHPADKTIEWAKDVKIEIEYELPNIEETKSSREQYQLIVIGPDEYNDELAPFISWKNGRGVSAKFVGLNEVYQGTGRDNQEKIKYYIKDVIENWGTSNVLLVGKHSQLPARDTYVYISDEEPHPEVPFATDLYYADIYDGNNDFSSWDSNDNDLFGEKSYQGRTDDVDLHPDVYLGRWAVRNAGEVETCVNKVKNYEYDQAYQQDWFKKLISIGGDSFDDDDGVYEGEKINQLVINMMTGFTPTKLQASNGGLEGIIPSGVQKIQNAIGGGCGFVDFSGHGNTKVWSTHPTDGPYSTWIPTPWPGGIRSEHVQTITNGNKLPIVKVEACSTAKFNKESNTFNWAFMHNSNGGAIGTFGATALGWGYIGNGVSQGLIGKIGLDTFRAYAKDDAITLGEMWAWCLERFIDSNMNAMEHKCTEEWVLFGDPTLQIGPESGGPLKPQTPNGPPTGSPGNEYEYSSQTTDPEDDDILYMFDWDDGTSSGWIGPVASGTQVSAKKTWDRTGTFEVKVVAKDIHGKVSEWSDPLSVTMPRNRAVNTLFLEIFEGLLEKFPNVFPILRHILGL